MNGNEYAEFTDEAPVEDAKFAALNAKVLEIKAQEQVVADLADQLAKAQEKLRDINTRELPEMMDALGLEEFKTKGGLKITIKEQIEAAITQDRQASAHQWLDDNGHSGLLKRNVTVAFNKDQAEAAAELAKELSTQFPAVSQKTNVHPSTLKAWVREMLAGGKPLPLELFGVFRRRVAQIHEAKK